MLLTEFKVKNCNHYLPISATARYTDPECLGINEVFVSLSHLTDKGCLFKSLLSLLSSRKEYFLKIIFCIIIQWVMDFFDSK